MKIRAILYENDSNLSTNAQQMAQDCHNAGFELASIVFNVHNGPKDFNGSNVRNNVATAITDMHNNHPVVKILGYVDSGGAQLPTGSDCTTSITNSCGDSKTPSLCTPDGDLAHDWNHFARTSTDWDLSVHNCYTNYHGSLRKQTPNTGYMCISVLGYIYDQMADWMNNLGADGIMLDNVYPGPISSSNWSWTSSESHYSFYKAIYDHMHNTWSNGFILMNSAGYIVPEEWVSTSKSSASPTPIFDCIQVYEGPYMQGSCTFPPNYYSGPFSDICTDVCGSPTNPPPTGTLPTWLTSAKYSENLFFASLYCPNGVVPGGSAVTSWYQHCCSNSIGSAYITSGGSCSGGGSYTTKPSNWADQVSAIGVITC